MPLVKEPRFPDSADSPIKTRGPRGRSAGDAYFSADVETDGPVPGPYSMLSFALVYAGAFDGEGFTRPPDYNCHFYRELAPISRNFEDEALAVNGLDRDRLIAEGDDPAKAMEEAGNWVREVANGRRPVLVAYPVSFDWTWLFWYFTVFAKSGSPFNHSHCFDMKTAYAVKAALPIALAGRSRMEDFLLPDRPHTHHALDDAVEQAEIFANLFEWRGYGQDTQSTQGSDRRTTPKASGGPEGRGRSVQGEGMRLRDWLLRAWRGR